MGNGKICKLREEGESACGEEQKELSRRRERPMERPGLGHGLGTPEGSREPRVATHSEGRRWRGQQGLALSTQAFGFLFKWK